MTGFVRDGFACISRIRVGFAPQEDLMSEAHLSKITVLKGTDPGAEQMQEILRVGDLCMQTTLRCRVVNACC